MMHIFAPAMVAYRASAQANLSVSTASSTAAEARTKTELMATDVEKLFMITEALWTMVRDQMGFTDQDLLSLIENIDMRDGKIDGKVAKTERPDCPSCGRKLLGKHPKCLYCGTVVQRDPFER